MAEEGEVEKDESTYERQEFVATTKNKQLIPTVAESLYYPRNHPAGANLMPRPPLPFVRHRTANQILRAYRACRHLAEKMRWHAIWLLSRTDERRTSVQVASVVGLSDVTVRAVLHRWNAHGPDGLADRRASNGAPPKLTPRRRGALRAAIVAGRPPDGGLWGGPKVAAYVRTRWGVTVSPETGWRWLRELGFTPQVPHPAHPKAASPARRRAWQKT